MTITKQPTMIACDNCGCADYYFGTNASVMEQAKNQGWIEHKYKGKKRHFCGQECLEQFIENKGSRWDGLK